MGCIIKYKNKSIPEEQFLQYLSKQIAINNLFEENKTLANSVYEALGINQNTNPHNIKDFSFFASFGNPRGFLEAKKIGQSNDRFDKTSRFKNTDFYTTLEILSDGKQKLSIHFKHLEQGSNRGGGHAGLTFVFNKDKKINNSLVENLLHKVEEFRKENFTIDGDNYRINTNDPSKISPVDIREKGVTPEQKQQAIEYYIEKQQNQSQKFSLAEKLEAPCEGGPNI